MIKGNLSSFSLGEIFQSLTVNNHTGTMKILEKSGDEKYLYFSKGEICLFSSKSHPTLRIGEILVRQGKLERGQLEKSLEAQKGSTERLGKILIKSFGVEPTAIQAALETKIREEIYDLFLLNDAEFEFFVDHFPEEVFDSFQKNLHISINTTSVLMEGLRLADEWRVINKKVKTFNEIFVLVGSADPEQAETPREKAVFELVDGDTPVYKIFDRFPGSRFDCCKTLFEFLNVGAIRPLTMDECREKGEKLSKAGDLERSIDFLKFAVQLAPDRPEPLVFVGRLLLEVDREKEGEENLLKATHLYFEQGQYEEVIQVGEPLVAKFPRDGALLEAVFQASYECKRSNLVAACGDALSKLLISKGAKAQAAEVLLKVLQHFPKEFNRRIVAADILKGMGETKRAVTVLEEALEHLGGNQFLSEKIRALRFIYELSPDRRDVKQEINNLLALQEKLEHQKKRRFTIAGVASICLILLIVVPLLYEIKARELLSHAMRLEQLSATSGHFGGPRKAYNKVLTSFRYSTRTHEAEKGLERLVELERLKHEKSRRTQDEQQRQQEHSLRELKDTIAKRIAEAGTLERNGKYREAFEAYHAIRKDYPNLPQVRKINLPITITSVPRDCAVKINGKNVGKTPLVIRSPSGSELNIQLSRAGCEDTQRDVRIGAEWRIHFDMLLRPLSEFRISGPIGQPLRADGNNLLFGSRDGFFYSVNPTTQTINWRRGIGHFADLTSDPLFGDKEIVLGTVSGEVAAFSKTTGKSRWRRLLGSTILARPAISENGKWIAVGDLDGKLTLIDNANGTVTSSFQTENEIVRAPIFWSYMCIVASEDNSLYMVSVPEAKLLHTETYSHEITCDLVVESNVLYFTTGDGTVHAFDPVNKRTKWTLNFEGGTANQLTSYEGALFVGTETGEVVAVDVSRGKELWKVKVSDSPLGDFRLTPERLYTGSLAGEIISVDLVKRALDWTFRSDDSIDEAPLVIGRFLFVASTSGKFFVMEIFDR